MTEENAVASYKTSLTKINDAIVPMISEQLESNGVNMSTYQKQCVINAIGAINSMAFAKGKTTMDYANGNLTEILLSIASLQLNAAATPREVYFIERSQAVDSYNESGGKETKWLKNIEMGIEGDGNDSILSRFGRNIKKVHRHWIVKEGDSFSYPSYKGLEYEPPFWSPKGTGEKVMKVVYPIQYNDGTIEYFIGERAEVKRNLLAHISNNLNKKEMFQKKMELLNRAEDMTLDEILKDDKILTDGKVSPAWKSPQSREQMIERKIRNNIVKKIPKDFSTQFEAELYNEQDDIVQSMKVAEQVWDNGIEQVILEKANSKDFVEESEEKKPKKKTESKKETKTENKKSVINLDAETGEILSKTEKQADSENSLFDEGDFPPF